MLGFGFGFDDYLSSNEKSIISVALSDLIISKRLIIGLVSVTDDQKPANKVKQIKGSAIKNFIKIDFIIYPLCVIY